MIGLPHACWVPLLGAALAGCVAPVVEDEVAQTPAAPVSATEVPDRGEVEVHLAPVDDDLRRGCQEAADTLGFAVPCPTHLPGDSGDVGCETPAAFSGAEIDPKFGCVLGTGFILEPEIRSSDADATIGHFVIEAGPGGRSCAGESATDVTVDGVPVHLARCDEDGGLHSGHVAAVWESEGVQYVVSAHDWTEYHQQAILDTVAHVELVEPTDPA